MRKCLFPFLCPARNFPFLYVLPVGIAVFIIRHQLLELLRNYHCRGDKRTQDIIWQKNTVVSQICWHVGMHGRVPLRPF